MRETKCSISDFQLFIFTVLLVAIAKTDASVTPAALAVPAPISYTRAVPYNVPPFAASINTFTRTLAAPALFPAPAPLTAVAPAPFLPAAAPAPLAYAAPAPFFPAPLAAAPAPFLPAPLAAEPGPVLPAPFLPAPFAAAPAPYLPAPAVIPAARSIHAYAPTFRAPLAAPLLKK